MIFRLFLSQKSVQVITLALIALAGYLFLNKQPVPIVFGQQGQVQCVRSGCSGQLCVKKGEELTTTCEYREEYACYDEASCEVQANGECGWTQTAELTACIAAANPTPVVTVPQSVTPTSTIITTTTPTSSPTVTPTGSSCEAGLSLSELNFGENSNIKIEQIQALNQPKSTYSLTPENATNLENGYGISFAIDLNAGQRIEIQANTISPAIQESVNSYIFDPDGNRFSYHGENEFKKLIRILAEKSGTYNFVFVSTNCQQGQIELNAYEDKLLSPDLFVETLYGTIIRNRSLPLGDKTRVGSVPVKMLVKFPKLNSVERVSGTQDQLLVSYQKFDPDTAQMKTVTGTFRVFLNPQPTSPTGDDNTDITFFLGGEVYPTASINYSVEDDTLIVSSANTADGGYFPKNYQYVVQLTNDQEPQYGWSTRFATVDVHYAVGNNNLCRADINGDGKVDLLDYSTLSTNFFQDTKSCSYRH